MDEQDQLYVKQMESWIKEQNARLKQIQMTIETSEEIAEQNKIQLGWHIERTAKGIKEYQEWLAEREDEAAINSSPGKITPTE